MTYHRGLRGFGAAATSSPSADMTFELDPCGRAPDDAAYGTPCSGARMVTVGAREAQTALYTRGFDTGGIDGNFGTRSRAALVVALTQVMRSAPPSTVWSATASSVQVKADLWAAIMALPVRRSAASAAPPPRSLPAVGPEAPPVPEVEEPTVWTRLTSGYTPWVIGGVALAGIGAAIAFWPKKINANRRRS